MNDYTIFDGIRDACQRAKKDFDRISVYEDKDCIVHVRRSVAVRPDGSRKIGFSDEYGRWFGIKGFENGVD